MHLCVSSMEMFGCEVGETKSLSEVSDDPVRVRPATSVLPTTRPMTSAMQVGHRKDAVNALWKKGSTHRIGGDDDPDVCTLGRPIPLVLGGQKTDVGG
jgi:hypothetical protein